MTGRLLSLVLTPGRRGDNPQSPRLLEGVRPSPVVADGVHDANGLHEHIAALSGVTCIKPSPTRKNRRPFNGEAHRRRNVVEWSFRRVQERRRAATRYQKKAATFASFVWIAAGVAA